jgi:hypothetical protein
MMQILNGERFKEILNFSITYFLACSSIDLTVVGISLPKFISICVKTGDENRTNKSYWIQPGFRSNQVCLLAGCGLVDIYLFGLHVADSVVQCCAQYQDNLYCCTVHVLGT